jgi:hypothetical protein
METSAVQAIKLSIVAATGLSKDTLHVYVGLAVFLVMAAANKRSIASWIPWLAVLVVALLGEAVDMRDDLMSVGHWRWAASLHDVLNTVFWPTVFLLLARATGIFSRRAK